MKIRNGVGRFSWKPAGRKSAGWTPELVMRGLKLVYNWCASLEDGAEMKIDGGRKVWGGG